MEGRLSSLPLAFCRAAGGVVASTTLSQRGLLLCAIECCSVCLTAAVVSFL